jgi:hypothetical protein
MGVMKKSIIDSCTQITEKSEEMTIRMVISSGSHVYSYNLADDDSFEFEFKKKLNEDQIMKSEEVS